MLVFYTNRSDKINHVELEAIVPSNQWFKPDIGILLFEHKASARQYVTDCFGEDYDNCTIISMHIDKLELIRFDGDDGVFVVGSIMNRKIDL
jgi:hypothetical protein